MNYLQVFNGVKESYDIAGFAGHGFSRRVDKWKEGSWVETVKAKIYNHHFFFIYTPLF
jgi:hypothetical protein